MFANFSNPQVNNAGLMSNLNMEEKAENIEMMIKVNVLGTMLVSILDILRHLRVH